MQPILKFVVNNQIIERTDTFVPVRSSKNYLYAEFDFQTDDWNGKSKTVLFRSGDNDPVPVLLGETNTCIVPVEVLVGASFSVSIVAGNLITANMVIVKLYESGYRQGDIPEPSQTLYEQLMTAFDDTKQTVIDSAKTAESWAHGHAEYPDRQKDNAAYYAEQARNAAEEVPGRVTKGKEEIDNYVKQKEVELKGETGNVYFAGFAVVKGRLKMYSDPTVDKVRFRREGSRLKYRLAL
jgi:hypothetical protein|nr:MAG TPA: hypothetical protein [Caudoviricetes sp.]